MSGGFYLYPCQAKIIEPICCPNKVLVALTFCTECITEMEDNWTDLLKGIPVGRPDFNQTFTWLNTYGGPNNLTFCVANFQSRLVQCKNVSCFRVPLKIMILGGRTGQHPGPLFFGHQEIFWCFGCLYNGPGKTTDKGEYACFECARPFPGASGTDLRYSSTLPYNLVQALSAAEVDSCEFYRWVVDRTTRLFQIHERTNGWKSKEALELLSKKSRFELRGISSMDGDGRANIQIDFFRSWAGEDGAEHERRDGLGNFDVWTTTDDPESKPTRSTIWPDIPTRLLDVGFAPSSNADASCIKLIETTVDDDGGDLVDKISRAGFIALSYCWGGDQNAKLVASNLQAYKTDGINVSSLDQSLQDAVCVARQVGIRYLWIDALCILQDDDDGRGNNADKSHEIGRMSSYYGRATLTILAASATRAVDGFLQRRKPVTDFELAPTRIQLLWSVDEKSSNGDSPAKVQKQRWIFFAKEPTDPVIEPITARGWTLQESLLSRRILIFGLNQLYWSCINSFAGCGGKIVQLIDRTIPGIESLVPGVYPVGSLVDQPVFRQWNSIVKTYTRRFLSQSGDKLWAVSALASHIVQVSAHRGERPAYVAGLLVDEANPGTWLQQLLWYPDTIGRVDLERPRGPCRAPSWSWASVDGVVKVPSWSSGIKEYAVVEGWEVELVMQGAPYGGLTGGHILLSAVTQSISPVLEKCSDVVWAERVQTEGNGDDDSDWTYTRMGGELEGTANKWVLMLVADSWEDRRAVEGAFSDPGPGVGISLVGLSSLSNGQLVGIRGIIVKRCAGDNGLGPYKRCGSFRLKMGRYADGCSDLTATFMEMGTKETLMIL
ncbi:heterokaryon incompatibility protein-domain-containing protein [Triangularia verruculosa]|uniref:Heterokaryon incompatibility protein-domain-containing protein n=1 Tax=Triangularia verruculosa TaxID=2587418 RepID=A0AAN6XGB8_9PEZI|nr:heterokaryon incompatibility protein-domain-containing protein [Triangularia verruculosa]